jgi:hypothetical protein
MPRPLSAKIVLGGFEQGYSKQSALALKTAIAIGEIFASEIFLVNAVPSFVYGTGAAADTTGDDQCRD